MVEVDCNRAHDRPFDLSQIAEQDWNEARRRADVLRPLAELTHCPRDRARAAAAQLGLSERQVYTCLQRLLAEGTSVREAARILRCHHATLYRALQTRSPVAVENVAGPKTPC